MKKIILLLFICITNYAINAQTPVAAYLFNGNANDAIGANHGTVNGATLTTDRFGNANSAYSFDGVDDFIGIGSLNFATNDYTISYWVNVNASATDIAVVSGNDPTALNQTFIMSGFSGGVGRFLQRNPSGATGGVNLSGIQTLTLGQWKFVTCTKQGTTLTYYVNGVADNTITDLAATNISSAIYLEFGRLMSSAFTPIYHLNGKIDEVKIYNTALTASQVLAEYNVTSNNGLVASYPFNDNANDTVGANHGTVNGATLTTDRFGNANSAYSFDGVDDAITAPVSMTATNNFSMSGWVKLNSIGTNQILFYNGNSSQNGYGLYLSASGVLQVLHGALNIYPTSATLSTNQWYYLAMVRQSGITKVYLNAIEVYNNSTSTPNTPNDLFYMSSNTIGTEFFNGVMDEVKIYNTAISSSQIQTEFGNSSSSLIAYYPFNSNATDSSGNNLHGTIIGSPSFTTDRNGNANSAMSFNGNVANRIEVDDNILLHTPSITIGAWVKFNSLGSIKTIVDKPLGSNISDSWHFGTENGNFSCWHFNNINTNPYSQVTSPISTNRWYYVVNTFDDVSKQHKLYIDGVLKTTVAFNSTIGYDNSKMYIGAAIENGSLNFPMDGAIDDIKIYGSAITASQILDDYKSEVVAVKPGSGDGISLDGSNDYVQLPSVLDGATQFTVDFWIKTTENRSSATYWQKPSILGNGNPSGPDGDFGISTSNGFVGVWHGFCCGDQSFETTTAINDNKWHHVAAVNDGSNVVLFVDGIQLAGSIPTGGGAIQNAARPWRLGMINSCCAGDTPHQGTLDEFRIWNIALTQAQIRDRMCKKIISTDALYANLSTYLNFDEKSGTSVFDGSANGNIATLHNDASRISSGAPIGNISSHDYSGSTASVNLAHSTRGDDMTVTLSSGSALGVQVYNVTQAPNSRNGVHGLENNDGYFGTFVVGGSSPTFNTVYNYDGIPNIIDENGLSLFSRADNSLAAWTGEIATINSTTNTLTKNGISASQREFIIGANDPGNISQAQSSCAEIIPSPLTGTIAYNGALGVTYQWQDSVVGGNWTDIVGATNGTNYAPPLLNSPKYIRRLATLGSLTLESNLVFLNIQGAIDTATIPSNSWNVYAFNGADLNLGNALEYRGFYNVNTLNLNSSVEWPQQTSPSSATNYSGCNVNNDLFTWVYKRRGFPSGNYIVNIPQHDDAVRIYVNDSIVFEHSSCCDAHSHINLGALDSSSKIEIRCSEASSAAILEVNFVIQNYNGGSISNNQSVCSNAIPNLLTNTQFAFGGPTFNSSYQWQDSSQGNVWQNISGATNPDFQPAALSTTTYFRRIASNGFEQSMSNIITINRIAAINPIVTMQLDSTLCANEALVVNIAYTNFTFGCCGGENFASQIFKNGTQVAGSGSTGNGFSFTLNNIAQGDVISNITTSNLGCKNPETYINNTISIDVLQAPTVSAGADQTILQGSSTSIIAVGSDSTYSWNTSPITNNDTAIVTPLNTTNYIVTNTASNGCTATDTMQVFVNFSALNVSAPQTNFGNVVVNYSKIYTISIANTGTLPETINTINIDPPFSTNFSNAVLLNPGDVLPVEVSFAPSATLFYQKTLSIQTSAGTFTKFFDGIGENESPSWQVNPSSFNFNTVPVLDSSAQTFTVTNTGNIPLTLASLSSNNAIFSSNIVLPVTIAVGGTYTYSVTFKPTAIGTQNAIIQLTSSTPNVNVLQHTVNGIGFIPGTPPVLALSTIAPFTGSAGVYPSVGAPGIFTYQVKYSSAANKAPLNGYPKVGIDRNGDGDFLDPNEGEFSMQQIGNDSNWIAGETYEYNLTLPAGNNFAYQFIGIDANGNNATNAVTNYTVGPLVTTQTLDLSIYANDITFSNSNPSANQNFVVSASIHNNSPYPVSNIPIGFYHEDTFLVADTIAFLPANSSTTIFQTLSFPEDGFYPIKVWIDSFNTISEYNKLNNYASRPVIVGLFSLPGNITMNINSQTFSCPSRVKLSGVPFYAGLNLVGNPAVAGGTVVVKIYNATNALVDSLVTNTNSNGYYEVFSSNINCSDNYTYSAYCTDFTLQSDNAIGNFIVQCTPCTFDAWYHGGGISGCITASSAIPFNVSINYGCQSLPSTNNSVEVFVDSTSIATNNFGTINPCGNIQFVLPLSLSAGTHTISYTHHYTNAAGENLSEIYSTTVFVALPLTDVALDDFTKQSSTAFYFRNFNTTCIPASAHTIKLFDDSTGFSTNYLLQTYNSAGLTALGAQYFSYSNPLLKPGNHYLTIITDYDADLSQITRANDTLRVVFYVPKPDLIPIGFIPSNSNPAIGDQINFNCSLKNTGTNAGSFKAQVYVDNVPLGGPITISNAPGDHQITTFFSNAYTITANGCPNTIRIELDTDNAIDEEYEINNSIDTAYGKDLTSGAQCNALGSSCNPYIVSKFNTYDFYAPVHNIANRAAQNINVAYQLNSSTLATDIIPIINAHGTYASHFTYSFNTAGLYIVHILPDINNNICEINEANNEGLVYIQVMDSLPDLKILSQHIAPNLLNPFPGNTVSVVASVFNVGNIASNPSIVKFFVDSVQLGADIMVGAIAAGDDTTVAATLTFIPTTVGPKIISVSVDALNTIPEVNELNNYATRAIICGAAPDFASSQLQAITYLPNSFNIGTSVTVSNYIRNYGGANGTAWMKIFVKDSITNNIILLDSVQFTMNALDSFIVSKSIVMPTTKGQFITEIVYSDPAEFNLFNNVDSLNFSSNFVLLASKEDAFCFGDHPGLGTLFYETTGGIGAVSFSVNGSVQSTGYITNAGLYTIVATDSIGQIDSSVLEILPAPFVTSSFTLSNCDSVQLPDGQYIYEDTSVTHYYIATNGCDSIVTYNVTINNSFINRFILVNCDSAYFAPLNIWFDSSGIYSFPFVNTTGCDSIIEVHVDINYTVSNRFNIVGCDSAFVPWANAMYYNSGTYYFTYQQTNGCDSIIEVEVIIGRSDYHVFNYEACDSISLPWTTTTIDSSGTYLFYFQNNTNCDSIIEANVIIHESKTYRYNFVGCDSILTPFSNTVYKTNGTYIIPYSSINGCDSNLSLEIILKYSSPPTFISLSGCDSLQLPTGQWIKNTGNYTEHYYNQIYCDSAVNYSVTIHPSTSGSSSIVACDAYAWENSIYTLSTILSHTYSNATGCDSVHTLYLTINKSSPLTSINNSGYIPYPLPWGAVANNSGTYTNQYQNIFGCDSTVQINFTATAMPLQFGSLQLNQPTCSNLNNGTVLVNTTGGSGTVSYAISPAAPQASVGYFTNLGQTNSYTISAADMAGTSTTTVINIIKPNAITFTAPIVASPSCNGLANGNITISAAINSGVGNIIFSHPTLSQPVAGTFINVSSGIYVIKATDANNCTSVIAIPMPQPSKIKITTVTKSNITCAGGGDGSIQLTSSGGVGIKLYKLQNNLPVAASLFSNLPAQIYAVLVSDANGCQISTSVSLSQPPAITFNNTITAFSTVLNNGSAVVSAQGGVGSKSYTVSPNVGNIVNGLLQNIPIGNYTCTAMDSRQCTATTTFVISSTALVASNPEDNNAGNKDSITVYPNPTEHNFYLEIMSDKNDHVQLYIYNALGKLVRRIDTELSEGNNTIAVSSDDWADGLYFVRIKNKTITVLKSKK